ncbi:MAG: dihydroorotase, partial [Methanomicrobiaceae archaeon]|nr:dihydroorotase [Methanomicrobiaceae archaeon]
EWKTGTRSALSGGVTTVVDQPNSIPPVTTPFILEERVRAAAGAAVCRFAINAAARPEADLAALWRAGAMAIGEAFVAPSSYAEGVGHEAFCEILHRALDLGAPVTVHAEEVGGGTDDSLAMHEHLRSRAGEARAVMRICDDAPPGARVHFCHLSAPGSISAACGTVEVTPHHLFLPVERFSPEDGRGKVNPPLRPEHIRRELWSCWDRIDVVASDHAPHTAEEKSGPYPDAPAGIPGVETMVPLLLREVFCSRIPLSSLIEKTSTNPSRILGLPPRGQEVGQDADIALYPRKATQVRAENLHSRAGWTPFEGFEAVFPRLVVVAGKIALRDGEITPTAPGWIPGNGYIAKKPNV